MQESPKSEVWCRQIVANKIGFFWADWAGWAGTTQYTIRFDLELEYSGSWDGVFQSYRNILSQRK